MNGNEILTRIHDKSGLALNSNADFEVLSQAICDATGERLGINTLKRMFGYKTDKVVPRSSTMDVIARYLGFSDYEALLKDVGEDADISAFKPIDCLDIACLPAGSRVRVAYEPNRVFHLLYAGDFRFKVEAVEGSHNISRGDLLAISQLVVGRRFVVAHVWRDGVDLGPYEAAKFRGIGEVVVEEPQ